MQCDAPHTAAAVAKLMQDTWPAHYGAGGAGDAAADVDRRSRTDGLPIGFVALSGDPVGVVALNATSFGALPGDDGPWLVGLAVSQAERGQGIGSALTAAVEAHAKAKGARRVFTTTQNAAGLLRRRGWFAIRRVTDDQGVVWQVMSKPVDQGAGI